MILIDIFQQFISWIGLKKIMFLTLNSEDLADQLLKEWAVDCNKQ